MNLASLLLILILMCVAPFLIIPTLTLLALAAFVWLLMQISVLFFQGALVLTAFARKKVELHWKSMQAKPIEQTEEIKQIEGAKL